MQICWSKHASDPSLDATVSLGDQLVDRGWLTIDQKTTLEQLLDETLQSNDGDIEGTLAAVIDGRCLEALRNVAGINARFEAKLTLVQRRRALFGLGHSLRRIRKAVNVTR